MRSQADLQEMLLDLLNLDSGLSEWEVNFIDDMSKRADLFTPNMANKIEELWNKHF